MINFDRLVKAPQNKKFLCEDVVVLGFPMLTPTCPQGKKNACSIVSLVRASPISTLSKMAMASCQMHKNCNKTNPNNTLSLY